MSDYKEIIKKNIDVKSTYFWDFNKTQIQGFINNFYNYDSLVGYILLDILIYYNANHCKELVQAAIMELKRKIWLRAVKDGKCLEGEKEINEYVDKYLGNSYIFPVSNIDESGTSSGILEGYYRRESNIFVNVKNYKSLNVMTDIISANKPTSIIFIDDIIGTGNQFIEFFSVTKHFNGKYTLENVFDSNKGNIDFYYIVFASYKDSLKDLNKKYKDLKIISVEIFDNNDKVDNPKNEYWEVCKYFDRFSEAMNKMSKKFPRNCTFSLNLPILYSSGRAQNTSFEYYWNNYNGEFNILNAR